MLLIFLILFVKIELLSCIFENKIEQNLYDEINRERKVLGRKKLQIHLKLQHAADKRCSNKDQLIESYEKMIKNTYKYDEWATREQLYEMFPLVVENIYLNGIHIRNDIFHKSYDIPSIYRADFIYIGIAQYQHENLSAKCILYSSSNDSSLDNRTRLFRLLYILIGCGLLLLCFIICSIINDGSQILTEQQVDRENISSRKTMIPKKSMGILRNRDQIDDYNRMTATKFHSAIDERSSAVHSFFRSPTK